MICVFDIETIPDIRQIALAFNLCDKSPIELCEHAFQAQLEKSNSSFLPLYWHRIIAISSVVCDDYGNFKKVGSFGKSAIQAVQEALESTQDSTIDSTTQDTRQVACYDSMEAHLDMLEKTLIEEFFHFLNTKEPRLVSFNGRGFDMPLLLLRAMKYNCSVFGYFEARNAAGTKNKWENYRARYSEYWHTDLLDSLGSFGAVRQLTLDGVCKMLGLVGKYDMSGDDVYAMFFEKHDLAAINSYCQSDVLNTYWLYLKYALLKGELAIENYGAILQEFSQKLQNLDINAPYTKHFQDHINTELARL